MPRVDPGLTRVVVDLERGLRELGIPFGIVGALVPELLLGVRPYRKTNDVDVAVVVAGLEDFEQLKGRLADYGFTRARRPHRLNHRDGGWVDILPFNEEFARDGLELEEGLILNMAGFGHVVPNVVRIPIEGGPTLPVAPLPLHVLLKLVAFSDRAEPKDLAGVLDCLEHYLEDDGRRYGVDHDGEGVPYEYTGAYLVGVEARPFLSARPSRRSLTDSTTRTRPSSESWLERRADSSWKTRTDVRSSSSFACAEHDRQLGGESPLPSPMAAKG